MTNSLPVVNVLYGTVTGNAEEIGRRIHNHLLQTKLQQGLIRCLSDYADIPCFSTPSLPAYNVIVVSTTGDGDPPETIRPFMKLLRKKDPSKLSGLQFCVLALGDTNYENFCRTGKRIDTALPKLGAERFYRRGDADDGTGLELVVEPWLQSLWKKLDEIADNLGSMDGMQKQVAVETLNQDAVEEQKPTEKEESETKDMENVIKQVTVEELGFDESRLPKLFPPKITVSTPKAPIGKSPKSVNPSFDPSVVRCANVSDAKLLTATDAEKAVWHMEVTVDEANSLKRAYRPGDAFGVIVENDRDEVARFLDVLRMDGSTLIQLAKESGDVIAIATIAQFVKQRIDLRAIPKKQLLRCISDYCTDIEERKALLHLSSKDGRKAYTAEVVQKNLSVVQLLEKNAKSCRAPISLFLDQLPGVAPRWYSATSSPELDGKSVLQFAFSVVDGGLATVNLASKCLEFLNDGAVSEVLLIPRESDSSSYFRPPKSLSTSYIMIGPGTGVAPFRGFLRERAANIKDKDETTEAGKTVLFFGFRNRDKDFLYREDLEELVEKEVLNSLDLAVSREGPEKVYVQHKLKARAEEVAKIIGNGGSVYVCGDGGDMAQSVHLTLGSILGIHCCDGDEEAGKAMLRNLADEHRYVRDIWFYG